MDLITMAEARGTVTITVTATGNLSEINSKLTQMTDPGTNGLYLCAYSYDGEELPLDLAFTIDWPSS